MFSLLRGIPSPGSTTVHLWFVENHLWFSRLSPVRNEFVPIFTTRNQSTANLKLFIFEIALMRIWFFSSVEPYHYSEMNIFKIYSTLRNLKYISTIYITIWSMQYGVNIWFLALKMLQILGRAYIILIMGCMNMGRSLLRGYTVLRLAWWACLRKRLAFESILFSLLVGFFWKSDGMEFLRNICYTGSDAKWTLMHVLFTVPSSTVTVSLTTLQVPPQPSGWLWYTVYHSRGFERWPFSQSLSGLDKGSASLLRITAPHGDYCCPVWV